MACEQPVVDTPVRLKIDQYASAFLGFFFREEAQETRRLGKNRDINVREKVTPYIDSSFLLAHGWLVELTRVESRNIFPITP